MCKLRETFHPSIAYKLAITVFAPTSFLYHFQNRNLWWTFQTLFARKRRLAHPFFLHENESFQHCLRYDLRRMAIF